MLQYDEMAKAWAELGLKVPTVTSSLDEKADRILAALDADGGGTISVKEFEAYMLARDVWCKPEDVADIVSALDTNKDGVITREELRAGLAQEGVLLLRVGEDVDFGRHVLVARG